MVYTISQSSSVSEVDKGSVLKRYAISFIVSLPFFTHGVETTNLTISTHSIRYNSAEEIPWTSMSLVIASICSAMLYSYALDKWGRRFGIFVLILVQGLSCIPLLLPPSYTTYIIHHILSGISIAGLFICLPIYIREISPDKGRGFMVNLMVVMTCGGYLVKLGLGAEERLYMVAALVLMQLVSLFVVVESPCYLVKVGKIEAAKVAMGKLKCLPANDTHVAYRVRLLKEESERAKPDGVLRVYEIFKNQVWRDEIKIGVILFTVTILCGCIIFLDQAKTLIQLKTATDPDGVLVPVCMFAGSSVCVILLRIFDRKYLLTVAYSVMVLSMGTLAVFTQADLTVTSSRWLPVVALGVLVFGYGMAFGLPTVILVEMFNLEIRAKLLGLIYAYAQILRLVHTHTFQYIEDYVGIYTLLYIFGCINLYGAVYAICNVPDLKDKNVRQIEKSMKRIPII